MLSEPRYACRVIVHLNGRLVPREEAHISPFDRGFIFGDGVYEGLRTIGVSGDARERGGSTKRSSRVIGLRAHVERLRAGLEAARFNLGTFDPHTLGTMTENLLNANDLRDAFVYWQITRGTPGPGEPVRHRVPPSAGLAGGLTVFGYCSPQTSLEQILASGPVAKRCGVLEDPRWRMGHLKSTSLMGNVVSAIEADQRGCDDAVYVRNGVVSEGLATNVFLLLPRGEWVTPQLESASMLAGVTRAILIEAGERGEGPRVDEREVRREELFEAREIVLTGSSTMVASVTTLVDGGGQDQAAAGTPGVHRVGDGSQTGAVVLLSTLVRAIRDGTDERLPLSLMQGRHWQGFAAREAADSAPTDSNSTAAPSRA